MRVKKVLLGSVIAAMCAGLMSGCGKSEAESQFDTYAKCAEIDSSAYTGVEYVPESREVTDDDVDSAIDSFCSDNSETSEDTESPVADGDTINVDYVETISGTEQETKEDFTMVIGNDVLGDGTDNQLIGVKPGETHTVSITYPDDYEDTTLAGLTAKYEVTVNHIEVTTVPEYTDELVNSATDGEYTTTDEYTAYLTENLQTQKDDSADSADRAAVLEAIVDKTTFDKYPEAEAEKYVTSMVSSYKNTAENYGIDFETYMTYLGGYKDEASFREYVSTTVQDLLREKIVVSVIALDNDLIANDDDIKAYRQKLVEDNNYESEDDVDSNYTEEDIMFYATEEKVLDFVMGSAAQVESTEETTDTDTDSTTESE